MYDGVRCGYTPSSMPRKQDRNIFIAIRISTSLKRSIDAEVARLNRARPGETATLSDVVRSILIQALAKKKLSNG